MNIKTSITLSPRTLRDVDDFAKGRASNRSRVIEEAVREYLVRRARGERDRRDIEVINRAADDLNREVDDALIFQREP